MPRLLAAGRTPQGLQCLELRNRRANGSGARPLEPERWLFAFHGMSRAARRGEGRCSCGNVTALRAPVRTGAHVGAHSGAHVGAQNGAPLHPLERRSAFSRRATWAAYAVLPDRAQSPQHAAISR
jgi:hypothetical protein